MRFGIYARGLSGNAGGVLKYIDDMVKAVAGAISADDELYIIHNLRRDFRPGKLFDRPNVREIRLRPKNPVLCDHIAAPRVINRLGLDAVWYPKNVIPYGVRGRAVVTIHDLIYFFPRYNAYKFLDTVYMKWMIRRSVKRAFRVIAISKQTKEDIVAVTGAAPSKIEVIHEAVDKRYRVIRDKRALDDVRKRYGLPKRFILFTGSISPRKNLSRLLEAFSMADLDDISLVLTGGKGWKNDKELRQIKKNPKVMMLGYVPEKDMPALYNLAEAYAYLSLYEGFGLPQLEAQACGVPLLCSNASCMPEIAGEGALFVDPYDVADIANGIRKILSRGLRKRLARKGLQNVKRFSYKRAAKELISVMQSGAKAWKGPMPLVSVITVVLNDADHIDETIRSVREQTYSNVEHIIIDGGSTDGTVSRLRRHKGIRWISEPDRGMYHAINKAVAMAKGGILNILNSGDLYSYKSAIKDYVEVFRRDSRILYVIARSKFINDGGEDMLVNKMPVVTGLHAGRLRTISHQAFFYRKELHDLLGPYDTTYRISSDGHFMYRAYHAKGIRGARLDRVTTLRRPKGLSSSLDTIKEQKRFYDEVFGRGIINELYLLKFLMRQSSLGEKLYKMISRIKTGLVR